MSHAAVGQPKAALEEPAHQEPTRRMALMERVSDITAARAVAQAVRAVPGVVDLSLGSAAPAATYGAGQRVTGVVVSHLTPDEVALEVHVILSAAHCHAASASATIPATEHGPRALESLGSLTDIAGQIREMVHDAVHDMASLILVRVDVFIDDLR